MPHSHCGERGKKLKSEKEKFTQQNIFSICTQKSAFVAQHSLVLLAIVSQDEIFELHLHFDPLLIGQSGPDVVGLGDCGLVRLQDNFGTVIIDMKCSQD